MHFVKRCPVIILLLPNLVLPGVILFILISLFEINIMVPVIISSIWYTILSLYISSL